jgi:heptosyltransferase-2/heptosyltransferase-3
LVKLIWIILHQLSRIVAALVRKDTETAWEHARGLGISLHEDLLNTLVAVQERVPLWRKPNADIDRILIVKLDRIGDMVTTTPVFDALRDLYPKARLDVVGHPVPLSLLDGDERIGERIHYRSWMYHPLPVIPPGPKAWLLLFRLLFRRYPLVVYLRGSIPFLLLGLSSRLAATKYVLAEPVIDRYMKAVRKVCGPVGDFPPRLHVSPENAESARRLLHGSNGHAGLCVTIHAAASSPTKMWPPERFARLADDLHRMFGAHVHFLGSPADRPVMERIGGLAETPHSYHWSLRLPQSVAMIAGSDLFIGNDSGLAHIAAAVGIRAVVLWGPANLPMARPKAPPEECVILYHELSCRETCLEFRCQNPIPMECLMRTQAEDVVEAATAFLTRSASQCGESLSPPTRSGQTVPLLLAGE